MSLFLLLLFAHLFWWVVAKQSRVDCGNCLMERNERNFEVQLGSIWVHMMDALGNLKVSMRARELQF